MKFRACHEAVQEHSIVIIRNVQVAVRITNVKSVDLGLGRHASVCVGLVARDAATASITLVSVVTSVAKKIFAKNIWANEVIVPVAGVSIILANTASLIFKDNGLRRVIDFPNHNTHNVGPMSSFIVLVKVCGMVDCRVRNDLAEIVVGRWWYKRILVVNGSRHLIAHPTRFAETYMMRKIHLTV